MRIKKQKRKTREISDMNNEIEDRRRMANRLEVTFSFLESLLS